MLIRRRQSGTLALIAMVALLTATAPRRAHAAPNCFLLINNAISAVSSMISSGVQAYKVCTDPNMNNLQCAAVLAVAGGSVIWASWNVAQFYCQCRENPQQPSDFCKVALLIPQPPAPAGGNGAAPGPGPALPIKPAGGN
jgi:hypothetical protein